MYGVWKCWYAGVAPVAPGAPHGMAPHGMCPRFISPEPPSGCPPPPPMGFGLGKPLSDAEVDCITDWVCDAIRMQMVDTPCAVDFADDTGVHYGVPGFVSWAFGGGFQVRPHVPIPQTWEDTPRVDPLVFGGPQLYGFGGPRLYGFRLFSWDFAPFTPSTASTAAKARRGKTRKAKPLPPGLPQG